MGHLGTMAVKCFRTFQDKMGVSKNMGTPPQIINFNRVFHEINNPFWGATIFGNTQIDYKKQPDPWHGNT